ncbi:hypothetical protein [Streptomyces sp. NPDC002573]
MPNAIALTEITTIPPGMDLPVLGTFVGGEVFGHAHKHQVRVRLDE